MAEANVARKPRPYVMHSAVALRPRQTILDAPDMRIELPRRRQLSPEEARVINRPSATDPRLRPADRLLERWAVTHGSGPAVPSMAEVTLIARTAEVVPALDDRESLLVDATVQSSPVWARSFAMLWYRAAYTVQEIADALRISRRQAVYEERRLVLAYYLGRFVEIGLPVTFWVES